MEIIQHTAKTKASLEEIWKLWTSVDTWDQWDQRIESSHIFGSFEEGVEGEIKLKNIPCLKIKLTSVAPKKSFVMESKVMGVKIVFSHSIQEEEEHLLLTLSVEMKGPLASVLANSLGPQIKKNVPQAVNSLLKIIEEKIIA